MLRTCLTPIPLGLGLLLLSFTNGAQAQQKPTAPTGIQAPAGTTDAKPAPPAAGKSSSSASDKPIAAAKTMQLKRTVSDDLSYRFITAADQSAAPTPLPAAAGTDGIVALAVPPGLKVGDAQLEVIDNSKGKTAHLAVSTSGVTSLAPTDFTLIQTVLVPVQVRGKGALTGAAVTLSDAGKKYTRTWLLKPNDGGAAQFNNVPQGVPITVSVSAGSNTPVSQTQTLPADPPADGYHWPAILVDWADAKTVPLPAASTSGTAPGTTGAPTAATPQTTPGSVAPPAAPQPSDPLGGLIQLVVSLLFLGAVGYGLFWAYQHGHLKKLLDNLGVQTQAQTAAAAGPQGSPFDKPQRAPIQPITEGTADPLAGGGFAAAPGMPGMAPIPGAGPRLVATVGAYAGNIFPIGAGAVDIGRDAMNGVPLPQDTNASRRHAVIQALNGQYTVTDQGSSNGTFVNGVKINAQAPQPLRPGDELQIGMTRFRFEA